MKVVLAVALILAISLFVFAAGQDSVKVQVPVLPTERDQFGGRPGTFHFVTNEQTMTDAAELQKAFAALDAIEKQLGTSDKPTRDRLAPEVKTLRAVLSGVHAQRNQTAGDTAKGVEERLNASKGKFMCGACHGMGMMHRGGMGMNRNQQNSHLASRW